jgi:heat shock protein HtpX
LEGVVAHELAHIKNRDILISSIAATVGAALTYMAHMAMFFGGRNDDEGRAEPARGAADADPRASGGGHHSDGDLADARVRGGRNGGAGDRQRFGAGECAGPAGRLVEADSDALERGDVAHVHREAVTGQSLAKLFSTHPATQERIARLRALQIG